MKELIKITTNEQGVQCVSARELHEGLEVKSKFADWIKNRINKYGFEENEDYICISKNLETQRNSGQRGVTVEKDYIITVDMAKELCMVENNELGRQFRRYFIKAEKEYKELQNNPYKNLSKELQAIFIHDEKIQKIENDIKRLQEDVPLYTSECEVLQNKLKAKIVKLLDGKGSTAYKNASLRKKAYVDIQNQIKREFGVNSYKAIARKNYQKALEIIDNYILPTILNEQVIKNNNQIHMNL